MFVRVAGEVDNIINLILKASRALDNGNIRCVHSSASHSFLEIPDAPEDTIARLKEVEITAEPVSKRVAICGGMIVRLRSCPEGWNLTTVETASTFLLHRKVELLCDEMYLYIIHDGVEKDLTSLKDIGVHMEIVEVPASQEW
jgi:hypothetical protein